MPLHRLKTRSRTRLKKHLDSECKCKMCNALIEIWKQEILKGIELGDFTIDDVKKIIEGIGDPRKLFEKNRETGQCG